MAFKMNVMFVVAFCMQGLVSTLAKPMLGGCGCEGVEFGGGFGGGLPFGGSFGGFPIGGGCGSFPITAPTPPISFLPVPQPVPIRIPQPPRQSVTIPNIILALLPPNQKPPCPPRPIIRPPPPVIVPLPQPYPLPYPGGCGC